jgi:hypothetical protein
VQDRREVGMGGGRAEHLRSACEAELRMLWKVSASSCNVQDLYYFGSILARLLWYLNGDVH